MPLTAWSNASTVDGRALACATILPSCCSQSCADQLDGVQRVLDGLVERHVARDDTDADHVDVRVTQRDDERDRVVTGGVRVDEEGSRHGGGA